MVATEIILQGERAEAVVLLHAYTGSPKDVQLLARAIHAQGWTVYVPAFRGHGTANVADLLQCTPAQWWQDTLQAVARVQDMGHERFFIFGLSMGGMMAIHALTHNLPGLIAGGSFNVQIPNDYMARIAVQQQRYLAAHSGGTLSEEMAQRAAAQLQQLSQFSEGVAERLLQVSVPVYIAQSGKDELIDVTSGEALARQLVYAEPEVHHFPESTHVITISKERLAFQESVIAFLSRLV